MLGGGAFGRGSGHEGGTWTHGISVPIRGTHMGSPLSMYSHRSSSDSSENFTAVSSWNSDTSMSSWPSATQGCRSGCVTSGPQSCALCVGGEGGPSAPALSITQVGTVNRGQEGTSGEKKVTKSRKQNQRGAQKLQTIDPGGSGVWGIRQLQPADPDQRGAWGLGDKKVATCRLRAVRGPGVWGIKKLQPADPDQQGLGFSCKNRTFGLALRPLL